MLNKELISTSIPTLKLQDSAALAMDLMTEYSIKQLPVVEEEKYTGLVFEDDLLNIDDTTILETVSTHFSKVSVHGNMHFIDAVQTANDYHLSVVPVVEKENDFIGVILVPELLRQLGKITGASDPGGLIVLEMEQRNFSFAEISKLIETNDAQITQLNTSRIFYRHVCRNHQSQQIRDIRHRSNLSTLRLSGKILFGEELYEK